MSDHIYNLAHSFIKQEPRAAARLLEDQELTDVAAFLENSPQHLAVAVIKEMLPSACASLMLTVDFSTALVWLSELTNNHISAVLRPMDKTDRQRFLNQLPTRRKSACQRLLTYNQQAIGAWVETDVPVFPHDMPAGDALKRLKLKSFKEDRLIFIIDDQRHPIGSLTFSTLLRNSKNVAAIENLAHSLEAVINGWVTLSAAIGNTAWHTQDVIAVVDRHKEFIGAISYRQIRQLLSSQSTLIETSSATNGGSAVELLQAYGDSVRGMLDALRKGIG